MRTRLLCVSREAPSRKPLQSLGDGTKHSVFVCLFRHAVLIQLSASRVPPEPQGAEKSIGRAAPALLQPHAPWAQCAADVSDFKSIICQLPPLIGIRLVWLLSIPSAEVIAS